MSNSNSSDGSMSLPAIAAIIYAIVSQIMTAVFWVQYVKTDSIIKAIFIDPFLAEFKGLLWPFFI